MRFYSSVDIIQASRSGTVLSRLAQVYTLVPLQLILCGNISLTSTHRGLHSGIQLVKGKQSTMYTYVQVEPSIYSFRLSRIPTRANIATFFSSGMRQPSSH